MHGFVNDGSSCFLDAVVVALFVPDFHNFFLNLFFGVEAEERIGAPDGKEASWEQNAATAWRREVLHVLRSQVAELGTQVHGLSLHPLRAIFRRVPTHDNNFGTHEHQSAVDLLRYLFGIFRIRENLLTLQTSTTTFNRRAEVEEAGRDVTQLIRIWMKQTTKQKYTRLNAHLCADKDEREYLEGDTGGHAYYTTTHSGDTRRVSKLEGASIFLCHITPTEANEPFIPIYKDLMPNVHLFSNDTGYSGNMAAKITVSRILSAPVLIFEVSRKMMTVRNGTLVEFKLPTPVQYVDDGNQLRVQGKQFELRSVVCHVGNTESGHYVAYIWKDETWWLYDDAAHNGEFVPAPNMDAHVKQFGELFFYVHV